MHKQWTIPFLLILCVFGLSGCTGAVDINDLAMVMAVGLDKGDTPGTVTVTAQIARPSDVVGQTGAPAAGTGEPIWTATATGRSIFEAIRNLGRYSSRRVYWGHNKVIVIGEDLARDEGINDVVDFFSRNHELRMRTWVVVTPDKASQIVATKTGLEVVPGNSIDKLFHFSDLVAEAPKIDLRTMQASYLSDGSEVVLPVVQTRLRGVSTDNPKEFGSTPQVELSGTAYFEKDKLKGTLNPDDTEGLMWFVDPPKTRVVVIPCSSSNPNQTATLEIRHYKFKVVPQYVQGRPAFRIQLNVECNLVELDCPTKQSHQQVMKALEASVEANLKKEISDAIEASKTNKVDFLGLGSRFQDRYPAEWQRIKSNWPELLSTAKVNIDVSAHIRSPVLLSTPTVPDSAGDR
ncbi:Ger(x)C family spore germination protein [Alicyclobacillus ferrooxydans]|uniref:Uncharacterized protein n=1 Tax=Alicyclobacillus ferrooxydans TaxID=471514 RepID=A0A0N8PNK8_9BACL|nr:Ger(x)C family spore germination protein [Alicyclobacillus ferrooxydans]KPV41805.1 hypothetical protein AN477_20460 [Alicyclobacillus ferrooxydans]